MFGMYPLYRIASWRYLPENLGTSPYEPHHEKTGFFAYAKTKAQISCALIAQLISVFVFATWIVQSLYFLNPKFQASSHLLYLFSPLCVRTGGKPKTGFLVTRNILYFQNLYTTVVICLNSGTESFSSR